MVYIAFLGVFLLLVLHVQSACYVVKVNYFEGSCSIKITQRPGSNLYDALPEYNEKLEPRKSGEKSIVMTRHHVIPFNTLRDFHNKLVESKTEDASKVRKFFQAFKAQYRKYFEKRSKVKCGNKSCSDKYETDIKNVEKFVTGLYENKMTFKQNGGTAEGFDNYEEFYVWLPGNLFVGPSPNDRTDDPGEGFEKGAKTIVGATMFSYFQSAYEEMDKYARTGNADFNKLSNSLTQITNSRLEPYPLIASQWSIKGSKKYAIK